MTSESANAACGRNLVHLLAGLCDTVEACEQVDEVGTPKAVDHPASDAQPTKTSFGRMRQRYGDETNGSSQIPQTVVNQRITMK